MFQTQTTLILSHLKPLCNVMCFTALVIFINIDTHSHDLGYDTYLAPEWFMGSISG